MVTQEDEDVHSAIERLLGPLGPKIHAGRSRNDQVAAAFRLYVEDACAEAREAILALAGVVLDLAEAEAETPMPGYTHLQRAQPVTVGHHLLAWVEMLERDLVRFAFAAAQAAPSPLGAGALAGSTLPLPAAGGRRRSCATRSTPSPTATSRSTTSTRAPSSSRTSRGSARSSSSGARASSASRACPRRRRPARR